MQKSLEMEASASRKREEADRSGSVFMETAVLEQRLRMEEYKTNFETLRAQHIRLQEVHEELKHEQTELTKQYHHLEAQSEQIITQLQTERDDKISECEQFKAKSLTPQKLKVIRNEIAQEINEIFKKDFSTLEEELNVMRSEHHKLQYSYQFLKSEYSSTKSTYESMIGELNAKHKAEMSNCARELKELRSRMERDTPTELMRIRQLQKMNAELQERMTILNSENEELRAEQVHSRTTSEQSTLEVKRDLMELQTTLQGLQLEKQSLHEQLSSARSQLDSSHSQHQSLLEQLSQSHRQVAALKRKSEEQQHRHHKDIGECKMKHQQELGQMQREKEKVIEEMEDAQAQCITLQATIQQLKTSLTDKERQLETKRQSELQREWDKTMGLERNRLELEEQLTEANRTIAALKEEKEESRLRLEEQLTEFKTTKSSSDAQLNMVKGKLTEATSRCHQLERNIAELNEATKKHKELRKEHDRLILSEQSSRDDIDRLSSSLRDAEHLISTLQLESTHMKEAHEQELNKIRSEIQEERAAWTSRTQELTSQLKSAGDKLAQSLKSKKKASRHHKSSVEELHRALEQAHEREKELVVEKDKEKRVAGEEIRSLQKQFHAVKRQQQNFFLLLNSTPDAVHVMEGMKTNALQPVS